ncbi:hypothetical protein TNCV_3755321 [Trichonephila clavipes]|nr:hypothetical protein TNCV_3755321 [Trichonephila clavipes]
MAHASGSENLRSVTHNWSDDRFVEQNFVPDRKFTPTGDKPFKNGKNSLQNSLQLPLRVCSMWWAKVNFASKNNPSYFATCTQGTGWPKIWTGVNPTGSRGLRVNMRQALLEALTFTFQSVSQSSSKDM